MPSLPSFPEGAPCWADAMFPDLEAAKGFYGELFGWTYTTGPAEFGAYTQALSDGARVAALVPPMPGAEAAPPAWSVYFASDDADATAERIAGSGGRLLTEPMDVGDLGRMVVARAPDGVIFGVWQAGTHRGFERTGEAGAYVWTEVCVRDAGAADAFYPAVFPFEERQIGGGEFDYVVWSLAGGPVAGRFALDPPVPDDVPPHILLNFGVADCDAAVAAAVRLGGGILKPPEDSPYGRFAVVHDPFGARLSLVDLARTVGDPVI